MTYKLHIQIDIGKRQFSFCYRFERIGGRILKRNVSSLDELEDYDLVVNCTGFGAKKLCDDKDLVPIRGQVFKVQNWLFYLNIFFFIARRYRHVINFCR